MSETGAPTPRWYIAEQVAMISNVSETLQSSWSNSYVFALEKWSKNLNFKSFFTPKKALVTTFNETRVPTSRKYVTQQDIMMPNLW